MTLLDVFTEKGRDRICQMNADQTMDLLLRHCKSIVHDALVEQSMVMNDHPAMSFDLFRRMVDVFLSRARTLPQGLESQDRPLISCAEDHVVIALCKTLVDDINCSHEEHIRYVLSGYAYDDLITCDIGRCTNCDKIITNKQEYANNGDLMWCMRCAEEESRLCCDSECPCALENCPRYARRMRREEAYYDNHYEDEWDEVD